jgi:hypothetical protein
MCLLVLICRPNLPQHSTEAHYYKRRLQDLRRKVREKICLAPDRKRRSTACSPESCPQYHEAYEARAQGVAQLAGGEYRPNQSNFSIDTPSLFRGSDGPTLDGEDFPLTPNS